MQPWALVSTGFEVLPVTSASPIAAGQHDVRVGRERGPEHRDVGGPPGGEAEVLVAGEGVLRGELTAPATIRTVSLPVTPPGKLAVHDVTVPELFPKLLLTIVAAG